MRSKNRQTGDRSKSKKNQRGAAMLETALVLLVTLSMIVFIFDMGRVLLTQQYISERARVAARNAVVNSWDATAVQNYVVYGSTTAPDGSSAGLMGLTTSEVTFTSYADSGIGDGRYEVTVQGVPLFLFVPYISGTYHAPTVTATAAMQSLGATN